ncbi:3-isopropylmalate dehydratase small subunit, partial [Parasphingorhabdus sp. JC815]
PSFAPIFAGNCVRNGILPAVLDAQAIAAIEQAHLPATINLAEQNISVGEGHSWSFPIDEEAKAMLLEGLDAIDLSMKMADDITAWQVADRTARPWIYLGANL